MDVADPAAFVADEQAKAGVVQGLAMQLSVPEENIDVELSVVDTRRLASARELDAHQKVQVEYAIEPTEGQSAEALISSISASSEEDFSDAINFGLFSKTQGA